MLNDVRFVLGQGGLGRPLTGQDFISGLVLYSSSLPSGFSTTNRIKQFFSVADAEAAGILANYNDETQATGTYLVTAVGANGNTLKITVAEPNGVVVTIANYTKVAGDTAAADVATAIAAAINAGTLDHGYSATAATATVTIKARKGLGVFLNSGTPIVVTIVGTIAGTLTQFTGGVASIQAVWHYHISEYFRVQPQGNIYVGIFAIPGTYTFTEVVTMQDFANGAIRQVGIYKDSAAYNVADVTAIHLVCEGLSNQHKELIALYGADISAVSDISTLADLSILRANLCSVVISQDGASLGAQLFAAYGKSITTLGAALGAVSRSKVSESIAWVQKFNISNGTEDDTLAFANGKQFKDPSITDNLLSALQDKRYIFLRKFVGVAGSFFNENSAATTVSSDYAYIADNRTIQKATRGVYRSLVPSLNSPITLNTDGTLTDWVIATLESDAGLNLAQMVRDGELSAYEVVINPAQNIATSSKLMVTINLVQIGTARNIQVNIGYNVSIN